MTDYTHHPAVVKAAAGIAMTVGSRVLILSDSAVDRFLTKVLITSRLECWPWLGALDNYGYGLMGVDGKTIKAHRLSYSIHTGPIRDGLHVLHTCDNRECCNPNHLWLGTNEQNTADKVAKNRQARGDVLRMSGGKFQRAKTACIRGHVFSPENTRLNMGKRVCRTCERLRWHRRKNDPINH